jgi:hypothetical protein
VLDALQLRSEMDQRVPNVFDLHEQQEERQRTGQETAEHARKVNDDRRDWQIGRMADATHDVDRATARSCPVPPLATRAPASQPVRLLREAVRE